MEKFSWNGETFLSGHKVIDHEHQFLVKSYNDLIDQINLGHSSLEALKLQLSSMLELLRQHFYHEELLLSTSNKTAHQKLVEQHAALIIQLEQEMNQIKQLSDLQQVLQQLAQWLQQQIPYEAIEFRKLV